MSFVSSSNLTSIRIFVDLRAVLGAECFGGCEEIAVEALFPWRTLPQANLRDFCIHILTKRTKNGFDELLKEKERLKAVASKDYGGTSLLQCCSALVEEIASLNVQTTFLEMQCRSRYEISIIQSVSKVKNQKSTRSPWLGLRTKIPRTLEDIRHALVYEVLCGPHDH